MGIFHFVSDMGRRSKRLFWEHRSALQPSRVSSRASCTKLRNSASWSNAMSAGWLSTPCFSWKLQTNLNFAVYSQCSMFFSKSEGSHFFKSQNWTSFFKRISFHPFRVEWKLLDKVYLSAVITCRCLFASWLALLSQQRIGRVVASRRS